MRSTAGGWRRCARYWTDEPGYRGRWTTTSLRAAPSAWSASASRPAPIAMCPAPPLARMWMRTASAPPASGSSTFDYAGYPEYRPAVSAVRPLRERDRFDLQSRPKGCRLHAASVTMRLSIVTTLYRSARHLDEFHARVSAAAAGLTPDYEIVFVNDGSPDDSLAVALKLLEHDDRVRIIDLARNFGHHKAMMTGLAEARGDLVFPIDSDLEEAPELLGEFSEAMQDGQADVVYGVQDARRGGFVERSSGWLFFKLFNLLSDQPIPENLVTVRLMTRRYVSALVSHRERKMMIAGLWALTGFNQIHGRSPKAPRDTRRTASGARCAARRLHHLVQRPSTRPDLLSRAGDRRNVVAGGRVSRRAPSVFRRGAPRVAVADRIDMDARRADAHLPWRHRHLPVEGVHRDQTTTVHDRPADLRAGHAGPCLKRFARPSDATTRAGSVSSDRRRAALTGARPSRRRCASTSFWSWWPGSRPGRARRPAPRRRLRVRCTPRSPDRARARGRLSRVRRQRGDG